MFLLRRIMFWSNYLFYLNFLILFPGSWLDGDFNVNMGVTYKQKRSVIYEKATSQSFSQNRICRVGWYSFQDHCYLPIGEKYLWTDFKNAHQYCLLRNGTLASITGDKEQAFLELLMLQHIQYDTLIGFHTAENSDVFSWVDNSIVKFTNWAMPKFRNPSAGKKCVFMLYSTPETPHSAHNMGRWKYSACNNKLPYICKAEKVILSNLCTHLEGWLEQRNSCFKFFNERKSWHSAEDTCAKYNAKLISISDVYVQTTFKYLSIDANAPSWIGLTVNNSNQNFEWINSFPMTYSNWDKNQPAIKGRTNLCFTSSPQGFWNTSLCPIARPFICQFTKEKPSFSDEVQLKKFEKCSNTNFLSIAEGDDYCYKFYENYRGISPEITCALLGGGNVISIHSKPQIENLKNYLKKNQLQHLNFLIGLQRNEKGGFAWKDDSPVDFEYWDEDEPRNLNTMCVEMKAETLKWKTSICNSTIMRKNFICSAKKVPETSTSDGAAIVISDNVFVVATALIGLYLYF